MSNCINAVGEATNVITPDYVPLFLDDYPDAYVPSNSRLQCNLTEATSLNLDPNPRDGARLAVVDNPHNFATYNLTLKPNGRHIEGSSSNLALSTNGLTREWFYRADTGNWVKLTALVAADNSPFPDQFDDLLVIGLYMRLSPRHGPPVSGESVAVYKDLLGKFRSKYAQSSEVRSESGLIRLTSNRNEQADLNTTTFQRGRFPW
jgi:hypothetical protein